MTNDDYNACVGKNGGFPDYARMAEGYYRAALIVTDNVIETRAGMDAQIYPVLELYRHGLELMSKGIAESVEAITGKIVLRSNHDVATLWKRLFLLLNSIETVPTDICQHVMRSLFTFAKWNPNAQMFRYPHDKTKRVRSLEAETLINFVDLKSEIMSSYDAVQNIASYMADIAQQHQAGDV